MHQTTRIWPVIAVCLLVPLRLAHADSRPNIIWIFAEDTSPWMGCYGDRVNAGQTPNIDSIANAGVLFKRAYVPAPVCSACRSAMMLGMNQIRFGAHEHRSSRAPDAQLSLAKNLKLLPQIMKENGYFTYNQGKTDYNFVWDQNATYSGDKLKGHTDSWELLKDKQPFFGQLQTRGGKNKTNKFPKHRRTDPESVTVPADYPNNEIYRKTVAQHYDAIRTDDDHIGKVLSGLKESGLTNNTIVVYFSDHGANNLLRHKQMPTEGGLHVPFVVMGPKKFVPSNGDPGKPVIRNDLVSMLDLTATTLSWAGIDKPDWYEGHDLFASSHQPRNFVASAKDRLDHTLDRVRTIRSDRFRYTRNYKLDRILLQPQYRDHQPYTKNLHELYASGKLPAHLKKIYFGEREREEFYDVVNDPHQLSNLANAPDHQEKLARHRKIMDRWLAHGDTGEGEESVAAMRYNADKWQGGRGVNPEYEVYREDTDGDGLSDKWEQINKRDPEDGRLLFEFDCGGWQTEGWQTNSGISDNLAGYLGFLDFKLRDNAGSIKRAGLRVRVTDRDAHLAIKLRSSATASVQAFANGKSLGKPQNVDSGKAFTEVRLPLNDNPAWTGTIKTLQFAFGAKTNDFIEIDSISVIRNSD